MYHLLVYVIKEIKVVTKELSSIMHKSYQKEKKNATTLVEPGI